MRRKSDSPCSNCGKTPSRLVRERKPGATGGMAQSFSGEYRLCDGCLSVLEKLGGVELVQERKHREARYTVLAKSFAYLRAMR